MLRPALLAATVTLASCAVDAPDTGSSAAALADGTPEAVGMLRLLADPATTLQVLDVDAALDRRAALNLIAHRDGADGVRGTADDNRFDTIAEVDGVSQVGPATLAALIAFADARGFVPTGDDVLGVFDGVEFTVDEAAATLGFVNEVSPAELDEVLRDRRPVDSIVAARPLASVQQLAGLYYVGPVMMNRLKDAVAASCGAKVLPARTGYGSSCLPALAPFRDAEPVAHATAQGRYDDRCDLGALQARAVDFWREHWLDRDQPWEFEPGYPIMNVATDTWSGGQTQVTVDIGADEDVMGFFFDAAGELVYFVHLEQSPNQHWFCAEPGDSTAGEPDVELMISALFD